MTDLSFLALAALLGWWGGLRALRFQEAGRLPAAVACLAGTALIQGVLGGLLGLAVEQRPFAAIRLLAWATFVCVPLLLGFGAGLARRSGSRRLAACLGGGALTCLAVAIRAFWIEPEDLQVSRYSISTAELDEPYRVLVIADLQTDEVGDYEERALRRALELQPDLLLFAGDYVQLRVSPERTRQIDRLAALMAELGVAKGREAVAVAGNCDGLDWRRVFAGTGVRTSLHTQTHRLGPITLTALEAVASRELRELDAEPGFHIALGHHPDFALGEGQADLLLAGHCHGGQVRIPWFGPLLKLSAIPRRWTSGLHEIAPGQHLCVSRGVGLERAGAPPLRFLCRPELVVIDLIPDSAGARP